jgi:hypothetical protein
MLPIHAARQTEARSSQHECMQECLCAVCLNSLASQQLCRKGKPAAVKGVQLSCTRQRMCYHAIALVTQTAAAAPQKRPNAWFAHMQTRLVECHHHHHVECHAFDV